MQAPLIPKSLYPLPPIPIVISKLVLNCPEGTDFKYDKPSRNEDRAIEAVRRIGTNGLPFILNQFAVKKSPMEGFVQKVAVKLGLRYAIVRSASLTRGKATTALLALAPLPPDAVSQLQTLTASVPATDERAISANFVLEMNAENQAVKKAD